MAEKVGSTILTWWCVCSGRQQQQAGAHSLDSNQCPLRPSSQPLGVSCSYIARFRFPPFRGHRGKPRKCISSVSQPHSFLRDGLTASSHGYSALSLTGARPPSRSLATRDVAKCEWVRSVRRGSGGIVAERISPQLSTLLGQQDPIREAG